MHDDEYASYLLRLYKSERQGREAWRASLENARTGERQYFHLEDLLHFLRAKYEEKEKEE
jgi:hypothetical protein